MPQSRTKYEFYKEASLSQKLAHQMKEYKDYAGSDPTISQSIAVFNALHNLKRIDKTKPPYNLILALLHEQRKAAFATSDKTNEITKMGLQMPKAEDEFYGESD